jgi:ATP-dependent Lon protease
MNERKQQNQDLIPNKLPVIPTMDVVVFPHMVVPLLVIDEQIIHGIEEALKTSKKVLLLATKPQGHEESPIEVEDLYEVGTVSTIMRTMKLPEGGIKVLVQGVARARVKEILSNSDILTVKIEELEFDTISDVKAVNEKLASLSALVETMSNSGRIFGPDSQFILSQVKDPEKVVDFILSHLNLTVTKAQELLEQTSILSLLEKVHNALSAEMETSRIHEKIMSSTRDSINQSQQEYYLREQLKAIKKELGEDNDHELEELGAKIAALPLPQDVRQEAMRQLKRLDRIPPDSMENTVLRNYLDWVAELPWGKFTQDNLDISHAKSVLDEDHFGLDEVKERVLDYLSVHSLKDNATAPILCFAGAPGVGKTSLGQSIAKSMGRKFIRISLGGAHDEAEIRGHRRTYVGAMPGRLIQAIRKAGSSNPLIMIDEIDKIGRDHRGDPAAALLEVLDPEQNKTFHDNFLGFNFDLSKVLFVATANDVSQMSEPLRDRMEVIHVSGYTLEEKKEIAKKYLITKALKNCGLEAKNIQISDKVIEIMVNKYTREAGVRQLERLVQKLCSKYARAYVQSKEELVFTPENIQDHLGTFLVPNSTRKKHDRIGVSTGLGWTPYGGALLSVEAVLMPGNGKLTLTGQLGDVMKESAQAALTYARAHADRFGITPQDFSAFDLHIHIPAGAIPKDGPSAGITLLSAILSAYTKRPVNSLFAMTGEVDLQGSVLPVGGIKEKLLAAKQEGLTNLIIPKHNEHDLKSLGEAQKDLNIILVEDVDEVLNHVLMPKIV